MRLPRQRIWPILPGVRSFLNYMRPSCKLLSAILSARTLVLPVLEYLCGNVLDTSAVCLFILGIEAPTIALSGMKRSPRTSTSLEVIAHNYSACVPDSVLSACWRGDAVTCIAERRSRGLAADADGRVFCETARRDGRESGK